MRQLVFKEDGDDYGHFTVSERIGVQLSPLYRHTKNENKLIKYISEILHHEYLHKAIFNILWSLYDEREEEIVHKISGTDKHNIVNKELYWEWDTDGY
jgi:hypothetical protein